MEIWLLLCCQVTFFSSGSKMNSGINIGLSGMHGARIGEPLTALAFLPTSCLFLACRAGPSSKGGTVCVYVCVHDVLVMSYGAMPFLDVCSGVISKRRVLDHSRIFSSGRYLT